MNENVWRANMGDLIIDQKRFTDLLGQPAEHFSGDLAPSDPLLAFPGADDGIATSQKQLSYSFVVKDSHFVVINTDPVGKGGHEHIFNMSQPAGQSWQVIVGSGGSPFEAAPTDVTLNPATGRTYAWATVKIHANGKVDIDAYGFSDSYGPTRKIQHATLKSQAEMSHYHH